MIVISCRLSHLKLWKNSTNLLILFLSTANKSEFVISTILEEIRFCLNTWFESHLAGLINYFMIFVKWNFENKIKIFFFFNHANVCFFAYLMRGCCFIPTWGALSLTAGPRGVVAPCSWRVRRPDTSCSFWPPVPAEVGATLTDSTRRRPAPLLATPRPPLQNKLGGLRHAKTLPPPKPTPPSALGVNLLKIKSSESYFEFSTY